MALILDPYTVPEKGRLNLKINRSFDIKVTAEEARRQVDRWLLNEVSYLMHGLPPTLVLGERAVWRVPASLGFPDLGQAREIGTIEVDAETGAMNNTPQCKAELERYAEEIAARLPPYRPREKVSPNYLAQNLPSAAELLLPQGETTAMPASES